MYKTLSTALQSRAFKWIIPPFILVLICVSGWKNISKLDFNSWHLITENSWIVVTIFSLTFLNLFCEMQKWRVLIGKNEIKKPLAFKAVLYGICSGIMTPNRLGEFAGRISILPKPIRKKATVMTIAGSGIQGIITLVLGIIGLLTFPVLPKLIAYTNIELTYFIPVGIFIVITVLFFWFRQPLKRHVEDVIKHLVNLSNRKLFQATFWALLRYAIFSSQFALALYMVGLSAPLSTAFGGIFLLYFCQSYIPFTAFGELGVREILAILIFGSYLSNPMLAIVATLIVWLANIGLPVIAGALTLRFSKHRIFGNS